MGETGVSLTSRRKGKRIPSVASLRTEYAAVFNEKKSYAGYREAKSEMRELLMAKANVDRLLDISASGREHDAERT